MPELGVGVPFCKTLARTVLQEASLYEKICSDSDHSFLGLVSETGQEKIDRVMSFFFLTCFLVES